MLILAGDDVVSNMDENEEEEAWLDALETGEVDERGYLPQKLDVSSLTTRQVCDVKFVTCYFQLNFQAFPKCSEAFESLTASAGISIWHVCCTVCPPPPTPSILKTLTLLPCSIFCMQRGYS